MAAPLLSSKLSAIRERGFALRRNEQPNYSYAWHTHDCAMLLWPRSGALHSAWSGPDPAAASGQTLLTRSTALFLPRAAAHRTRSNAQRQQHGELYIDAALARGLACHGAIGLDGAALAMLDALVSPTLAPDACEALVRALIGQLRGGRSLPLQAQAPALADRVVRAFSEALEWDQPLPSIDTLAAALGTSVRQLQRACQRDHGASPVDIRRRLQAEHARRLLAQGQTAAQVSHCMGFTHSGHLHRLLRGTA